jgi:hypothetical protein
MNMNAARTKNILGEIYEKYSEDSLGHLIAVESLAIEDIVARACDEIVAAGGGEALISDLCQFFVRSTRLARGFRDYLASYVCSGSLEFQQAPPSALVQTRFPYEWALSVFSLAVV